MSKFVHMELNTSDPEAAQKFYKAIFGWTIQKMKMDDGSVYRGIKSGEDGIGGIQKNPNPSAPSHWLGYVGVDSIKRTVAKIEKNGGKVIVPEMAIPNMGSLAIFTDPQGAVCAVWQAAPKAAEVVAAPAPAKKAAKKVAAAPAAAPAPAKKAAKKVAAAPAAAAAPAKKAAKKVAAAAPAAAPAKKAAKKVAAAAPVAKKGAKKKSA